MTDETKIISLADERDKRDGPEAQFVWRDEQGVKWFKYGLDYVDGDARFGFEIWATSFEDAARRLSLLKQNAELKGQLYSEVPL